MGFYVNPPEKNKSAWCKENGMELDSLPDWNEIPEDCCVIFVVNNGPFEAAAVAYKKSEYDTFQRPEELAGRPVRHFLMEKAMILPYSNMQLEDFQQ